MIRPGLSKVGYKIRVMLIDSLKTKYFKVAAETDRDFELVEFDNPDIDSITIGHDYCYYDGDCIRYNIALELERDKNGKRK